MTEDEKLECVWRDIGEGRLIGKAARAALEAAEARRGRRQGNDPPKPAEPPAGFLGPSDVGSSEGSRRSSAEKPTFSCQTAPKAPSRRKNREKVFGVGRPRPLDRRAKKHIWEWAKCLLLPTEKGRAYGELTPKTMDVLDAILWGSHNAQNGLCYPGYERISELAGCGRATVWRAIKRLEASGIMSWLNRLKRVRERCPDLLGDNGWRWRVLRTSNAYHFTDPSPAAAQFNLSKSQIAIGTRIQAFFSSFGAAFGGERTARNGREEAWRGEGWRIPTPDGVFLTRDGPS